LGIGQSGQSAGCRESCKAHIEEFFSLKYGF
jgi:hypothetical protein